jgi:hypothetical protein
MNKDQVRNIIEATLKSGNKTPGLFDLPKILGIKSKLESCSTISDVVGILQSNRELVCKAFGLNDEKFNDAINKLNTLL